MILISTETTERVYTVEETIFNIQLTSVELEELKNLAMLHGSRDLYKEISRVWECGGGF